ncbi:hypothetical protein AB0O82_34900 [Kitasatospora sp. NPDC088264]|uniref:hypothetical protein n=1 Tax=Kitasatospora sp. NPDC088264 TaxID=3155296 RepID=UPI0034454779
MTYVGRNGAVVGLAVVTSAGADAPSEEAVRALDNWAALLRTRRLVSAGVAPLCAGAVRAREEVDAVLSGTAGPVAVVGGLPVDALVAARWRARGVVSVAVAEQVPPGAVAVIGPAGATPEVRAGLAGRGVTVVDATCGKVADLHAQIRAFVAGGEAVLVAGRSTDAVTPGLTAQAAPGQVKVLENLEHAMAVPVPDPARVAVVIAPGRPVEDAEVITETVRARFGHVLPQNPASYCHAADDRAHTLQRLAHSCDTVLIAGLLDEPEAQEALRVVEEAGAPARLIHSPEDIRPEWLRHTAAIGVTATSTTDPALLTRILHALSGAGPTAVTTQHTTTGGRVASVPRLAFGRRPRRGTRRARRTNRRIRPA